jgi:DivIVA domain-containing protein
MGQVLLLVVVALTVAAVVFGVTVLVTGGDPALGAVEPDGRSVPLPGSRPLLEADVTAVRFDTTVRGYRMGQVDQALRRAAYDIGYKDELIGVLEAEVVALREGRTSDADVLRRAREAALVPAAVGAGGERPHGDGLVDLGEINLGTPGGLAPRDEVPPKEKPADKAPAEQAEPESEPAAKIEADDDRDGDAPADTPAGDEPPARP